ncbi:hypothetical protein [Deinococcus sp. Arct2-2]|uniref:hypothetical protein n=1 Tax=Deinococcus sp. Arct2-2 TaxID=2568653 RepID=UPI00197ACF50|nr:hypothetical protein [Deinococcus sp. Arct2-2]
MTQLLQNPGEDEAHIVQQQFQRVLVHVERQQQSLPEVSSALAHFIKVLTAQQAWLFHCYRVPGLRRTNNALERYLGSAKRYERRVSGQKSASPSLVIRGHVRSVAAAATKTSVIRQQDLQPKTVARWRTLRQELESHHETRRLQSRFRRTLQICLAQLEADWNKLNFATVVFLGRSQGTSEASITTMLYTVCASWKTFLMDIWNCALAIRAASTRSTVRCTPCSWMPQSSPRCAKVRYSRQNFSVKKSCSAMLSAAGRPDFFFYL